MRRRGEGTGGVGGEGRGGGGEKGGEGREGDITSLMSPPIQVLRSVDQWSVGTVNEHSILNAYIETIKKAEHFIYIEVQWVWLDGGVESGCGWMGGVRVGVVNCSEDGCD